jgi:MFS family permease
MGLVSLFGFMIWGDFANGMMQTVVPSIIPLKFKAMGASNVMIGLLSSSIPALLAVFMNPYISFKSDRHRSRWGRRIPFILFTLPPLCLSLVGLAFGEDIVRLILPHIQHLAIVSPATLGVLTVGALLVTFLFFDQFVNAVYCGLFNDVVPTALMGRFMGTMRIVGSAVGFFYNYFIFQYAESHMREIFLGVAALYFLGVGMMCLFVKEGEYPPPSKKEQESSRGIGAIKVYFQESFCDKFYWTKFLYVATNHMSWAGVGAFLVFFYKDMGLTLGDVGKVSAITSLAIIATAYAGSIFIDRWHPIRILTYTAILSIVFIISNFVWLFVTVSPSAFFWLYMMGAGLISALSNSVSYVAGLPFDMRLHPRSRFTQFCSAQTLVRSLCTIIAGVFVGLLFDSLKRIFPDSDYAYRFWFIWVAFWTTIAAGFAYNLYRQWQALGGDMAFQVPAPWSESRFEEQEQSPYVGPQTKWLKVVLRVIHVLMLASVLYLLPLCYWLWKMAWFFDLKWHLMTILPAAIILYVAWLFMERSIKVDLLRCKAGETPRNGILHHGVLLLKSLAMLLLLGVWIGFTVVALNDGLKGGVLVLGSGNLVINLVFLISIQVLRRMERGHDPMLDHNGHSRTLSQPIGNDNL